MPRIKLDINKCTGCKRCEVACSFFRSGKIDNHLSRIKVISLYEIGIDGTVVCVQCSERYCDCCPEHAITIGSQGEVVISQTLCTLCGACEKACPVGAVEIFKNFVYVCDLCGGRSRCLDACTEGAISFDLKKDRPPSLAGLKKGSGKLNTSQKRALYIKRLGSEVRRRWRESRV